MDHIIRMTEDERRDLIPALEDAIDESPALVVLYHRVLDARPDDDRVQFARLLCAIDDDNTVDCGGNGLEDKQIDEIFKRARTMWEAARPPVDFGQQLASYIHEGLDAEDILDKLDPDTAGVDLINMVKNLMDRAPLYCRFCDAEVGEDCHFHQQRPVCDECWDVRFRSTE